MACKTRTIFRFYRVRIKTSVLRGLFENVSNTLLPFTSGCFNKKLPAIFFFICRFFHPPATADRSVKLTAIRDRYEFPEKNSVSKISVVSVERLREFLGEPEVMTKSITRMFAKAKCDNRKVAASKRSTSPSVDVMTTPKKTPADDTDAPPLISSPSRRGKTRTANWYKHSPSHWVESLWSVVNECDLFCSMDSSTVDRSETATPTIDRKQQDEQLMSADSEKCGKEERMRECQDECKENINETTEPTRPQPHEVQCESSSSRSTPGLTQHLSSCSSQCQFIIIAIKSEVSLK